MGLLDVLAGMQAGPRGQSQPSGGGGGMSPVTMALLGLIAYKAVKSFSGASAGAGPAMAQSPDSAAGGGLMGGGLGDMVGRLFGGGGGTAAPAAAAGGLSSLLAGSSAGGVVSSGLQNLIGELQNSGNGDAAQSWVGHGANQEIAPNDLAKALGPETVNALAQHTGMNPDDLLVSLSQHLPELVNRLTPNGRLPTEEEASRMV